MDDHQALSIDADVAAALGSKELALIKARAQLLAQARLIAQLQEQLAGKRVEEHGTLLEELVPNGTAHEH